MKVFNGMTQEQALSLENQKGQMIGYGNNGDVYEIEDKYALKIFKKGSSDHIALEALQGSKYVPRLYMYRDNKCVLMERVQGINLNQFLRQYHNLPENIEVMVEDLIRDFGNRGWIPYDFKLHEHVIYNTLTKEIKYIDYDIFDNISHLKREPEFLRSTIDDKVNRAMVKLQRSRISKVIY